MKKQRSFTLIEILVVVAVVGLLSSVILVATKETREKAKITRLLQFSGSVHHTLGAYAVGIWNFNEGVAGTCVLAGDVCDISGNNNHGTWFGSEPPPHWVDHDNPQLKKAFKKAGQFDGTDGDDYIRIPSSGTLDAEKEAITIEFWLKQKDSSGQQWLLAKSDYWWVWLSEGRPLAEFAFTTPSGGVIWEMVSSQVSLKYKKWNHLVVTYDGSKLKLFLNADNVGALDVEAKWGKSSIIATENLPLFLGSDFFGRNNYNGLMDEVRIYSEGLASSQIKKHYTEGLKRRLTMGDE